MRHDQQCPKRASLRALALIILLVPRLSAGESLLDEETWVEVSAKAEISERNEARARDTALGQALEQAVEMVAATIVPGLSKSEEFIAVRDEMTGRSSGFVRRYEIKEALCGSDECRVTVRAQVDKQALVRQLFELGLMATKAPIEQDGELQSIRLDVEGFGSLTEIAKLHSLLSSAITGIHAVHTRSISGRRVSLELETTIGSEQLAAKLSTRPLGGYSVQVTRMDSTSVGIRLFGR